MRYRSETCRSLRAQIEECSCEIEKIDKTGQLSSSLFGGENYLERHKLLRDLVRVRNGNTSDQSKIWKSDARYFKQVYLSNLAGYKILQHALEGGDVEIMGMLVGMVEKDSIVVLDCYPLPVEGTETRVNAQLESYEYMVQYMNEVYDSSANTRHIVGWYHSHPGYGCWLSGIDVQTQELNQTFQDPYVAIVVDPKKSARDKRLSVGAFRTLPHDAVVEGLEGSESKYGHHSSRYYELETKLFRTAFDTTIERSQLRLDCPALNSSDDSIELEQLLESVKNWNNHRKISFSNQFNTQNARPSAFTIESDDVDMGLDLPSRSQDDSQASSDTSSQNDDRVSDVDMISNALIREYSRESSPPPSTSGQPHIEIEQEPQGKALEQEYQLYKTKLIMSRLRDYERLRHFRDAFRL